MGIPPIILALKSTIGVLLLITISLFKQKKNLQNYIEKNFKSV